MAQAAPTRALPMGAELQGGKFAVGRVLGEGGFGITYKGAHKPLQRTVALKELFPESAVRAGTRVLVPADRRESFLQERESILHEARLIASLSSPNILNVHDMFLENGTAYIVMEYLEGQTLQERIDSLGRLSMADVQTIALDTCEALAEIHSNQLLHRDIKPANIMLTEDLRTVLIDFGSAREFLVRQTRQHTRILTEDYAAPEQYSDQARFGPYTDIFCLGSTLFHALTGAPPLRALERLLSTNQTVYFPPGFRGPLCSAIQQALQLRIQDRPQDIEAFRDILLNFDETSSSAQLASSTAQTISSHSIGIGRKWKLTNSAGRLSSRGLILITFVVMLIGAGSIAVASDAAPFRSIASTFVLVSRFPTPIPTATPILVIAVPTRGIPTFTSTRVAPWRAPTLKLSTPTRVLLRAHTNTGANLRAGPGTSYNLVGVLARNTSVQPVSRTSDWLWLKLDTGNWIYAALVDGIPPGLGIEINPPAQTFPTVTPETAPLTVTPVPTSQSVPSRGDWSLAVPRSASFLTQDGLEIRIQDVIYEDDSRMQSYIERRGGQSCAGCLAIKLEIVNRRGNELEYLVQEDFMLLKGGAGTTPYPQIRCQSPSALRSMANPSSLRGLLQGIGGADQRVVCFEDVNTLSQDVKLAYSPVFIYVDSNSPIPTPVGSLKRDEEPREEDQSFRSGWSVFFDLLE